MDGGINLINKRFKELGLTSTKISNLLPDLSGTNSTSAKDLSKTFCHAIHFCICF